MEKLQLIFPLHLFTITLKSQLLYHSKFATFYPRVLHTDSGKSWWTSNHHDAMAPFTILSCNTNLFFFWDVTSWTNVIFSKNPILGALWHHSPPSKDLLFRNLKKITKWYSFSYHMMQTECKSHICRQVGICIWQEMMTPFIHCNFFNLKKGNIRLR